jgi:hypothetical protein
MLEEYMYKIKNMSDKEYLFGVILYSVAPTLAGHKSASIITLSRNNRNLYLLWEKYKKSVLLAACGVDFFEVKNDSNTATILFYNKKRLEEVIYEEKNMSFLTKYGYSSSANLQENLKTLKSRFQEKFPHEIGIFLGFPLEDVICFMKYPYKRCIFCGYWKVYKDPETAREKFLRYDEDKNSAIKYVLNGTSPSVLMK